MPDISIITCVSNPIVYQDCLLSSVATCRGRHQLEIIPIINEQNQYSASEAFNVGMQVARSDLLILCHQDVKLLGTDWIDGLLANVATLDHDWAVLGAAGIGARFGAADIGKWGGALHEETVAVGQVWGSDEEAAGLPYWNGDPLLQRIHAADECLMVVNRRHRLRFDVRFNGFHFYGVDLCLQARAAGWGVWGCSLPIIHYGKHSASLIGDKKYWVFLRYLHYKWKVLFPELLATHMHWVGERVVSYIPVALRSSNKSEAQIRAMSVSRVRAAGDINWGIE